MLNTVPEKYLHVVVAVIKDEQQRVLLAKRPAHLHQGGLWEFPGGKREADETVRQALCREINEELGIDVVTARPLIKIRHAYADRDADRDVLLDVWDVTQYHGKAHGRENQQTRWVEIENLSEYTFPEANLSILKAVSLSPLYLITPSRIESKTQFLQKLEQVLQAGIRQLQFRLKDENSNRWRELFEESRNLCRKYNAILLANTTLEKFSSLQCDGLHLTSEELMAQDSRPVSDDVLLAASCHSGRELEQAHRIGADFAVLSPVLDTPSHPGAKTLGWDRFSSLVDDVNMPVYALGGMHAGLMPDACHYGAQGVAVITAVWGAPDIRQAVKEFLVPATTLPQD